MKNQIKWLLTVCLLTGAVLTTAVQGQTTGSKASSAAETKDKKSRGIPFSGKLSAVDKGAMNITLEGRVKKRVIHVTSETKIVKAGKPAGLEDAVIGDEVGGQAIKNTQGGEEAISLRLGPKPEGEPKPRKRSKQASDANK